MKPISTTLYTRAFHRWYTATYGAGRARAIPRYLILTLEMMRLRSPLRHIRLLIHDPHGRLIHWLLAYTRWINEYIHPRSDPPIIHPGPRQQAIDTRQWPGLRFRSLRRPDSVRGTTTSFAMVLNADSCTPRPDGHDNFHRARTALTGMVNLRHSILIYHGNAHNLRHHFHHAWQAARSPDTDSPFLTYDAEHPQAILATLTRYLREYRPATAPAAPGRPQPPPATTTPPLRLHYTPPHTARHIHTARRA